MFFRNFSSDFKFVNLPSKLASICDITIRGICGKFHCPITNSCQHENLKKHIEAGVQNRDHVK